MNRLLDGQDVADQSFFCESHDGGNRGKTKGWRADVVQKLNCFAATLPKNKGRAGTTTMRALSSQPHNVRSIHHQETHSTHSGVRSPESGLMSTRLLRLLLAGGHQRPLDDRVVNPEKAKMKPKNTCTKAAYWYPA